MGPSGSQRRQENGGARMKKPAAAILGTIVIANACIWGFVILMSSHTLSGTGAYEQIQTILGGGAAASSTGTRSSAGGVVSGAAVGSVVMNGLPRLGGGCSC